MRARLGCVALALVAGCYEEDGVTLPCDITRAACQRAVFARTAETRGDADADMPPIRVISRAQLRDEIRASFDRSEPSPAELAVQRAYSLLGVLPAETGAADDALADDLAEGIAAYYQPGAEDITVISDSASSKDDGTYVLSHEFTHALQDQRGDLEPSHDIVGTDGSVAFDSLIEGEAVWISNLTMASIEGRELPPERVEAYFDGMTEGVLEEIGTSAAPLYFAAQILPYPLGGRGVFRAYEADDLAGIRALHDDEPDRMTYWLRGETPPAVRVACDLPEAPAGYDLLSVDRLGVVGLVALDVALNRPATLSLSRGWLDDLSGAYASEDRSQVALVYRVRFAEEAQAAALEGDLGELEGLTLTREGAELTIVAATDPAALASWSALSTCSAPRKATKAHVRRKRLPFLL